jgi:hypothetical protein
VGAVGVCGRVEPPRVGDGTVTEWDQVAERRQEVSIGSTPTLIPQHLCCFPLSWAHVQHSNFQGVSGRGLIENRQGSLQCV